MLFIIKKAFCPSSFVLSLLLRMSVVIPDSHVSIIDILFQHELFKGVVFMKPAAIVL